MPFHLGPSENTILLKLLTISTLSVTEICAGQRAGSVGDGIICWKAFSDGCGLNTF